METLELIETETEITEKRTEPSGMDIIRPENLVYAKPELMNDNPMHYCPGCSHGVIHKLIAEVIGDMGMEEKTVGVSFSRTTTSMWIGSKQPMGALRLWLRPSSA